MGPSADPPGAIIGAAAAILPMSRFFKFRKHALCRGCDYNRVTPLDKSRQTINSCRRFWSALLSAIPGKRYGNTNTFSDFAADIGKVLESHRPDLGAGPVAAVDQRQQAADLI